MITSYDYITAKMAEHCDFDINLIGDSLAMTALGYEDTNEITFDEFLFHVKSVSRGNKKSLLVADVPFGSFERGPDQAIATAISLIKQGRIQGVKIEGGAPMVPTISRIVDIGIPVMGHVGLTPQHHNVFGGFKLQGNSVASAVKIYQDCLALQKAGVFAIVLECVPNKLAQYITDRLAVPTIGIGAGPGCSGQVMVIADLLGMNPLPSAAKFVKQYQDFFHLGTDALDQYHQELKLGEFPNPDRHGYKMKSDVLAEFKRIADSLDK